MCNRRNNLVLAAIILALLLAGCTPAPSKTPMLTLQTLMPSSQTSVPSVTVTLTPIPSPTRTSLPTLTATLSPRLIEVINGELAFIWWSADGKFLCYDIAQGGELGYELLTLASSQTQSCGANPHFPPPSPYTGHPQNAQYFSISPSGAREIYLIPIYPTPTPVVTHAPDDIGEGSGPDGRPAEVWLWEDGVVRRIGQVKHCIYETRWSPDEQTVVAIPFYLPCPTLGDDQLTIIDIMEEIITISLETEDFDRIFIYDISPSGHKLLYNVDGVLHLLDLESLVSEEINMPEYDFAYSVWVDDSRLLTRFTISGDRLDSIGILNLDTRNMQGLLFEGQPPLDPGYSVLDFALSPDYQWLAYTAWSDFNYDDVTLWLLEVDLLDN